MARSAATLLDVALGATGGRPFAMAAGSVLLVRDSLQASGAFLLHHVLRCHVAASPQNRVCLLAMAQPLAHYAAVARKQGYNLQALQDAGRFLFFDVSAQLDAFTNAAASSTSACSFSPPPREPDAGPDGSKHTERNSLYELYRALRSTLSQPAKNVESPQQTKGSERGGSMLEGGATCILIDDASQLEVVAGGGWSPVLDFVHYCRTLRAGLNGERCAVALLVHSDIETEDEPSLLQGCLHAADVVAAVEPLDSGIASDVHGQVEVSHRTARLHANGGDSADSRLHFRISEASVAFFRPGSQRG